MILVLTRDDDEHASHVVPLLRQRGAEVVRHDPASFPRSSRMAVAFERDGAAARRLDGLDLREVRSIWLRRPGEPVPHDFADPSVRAYVRDELRAFVGTSWDDPGPRTVPGGRRVIDHAARKQHQLPAAARAGLEIPATLITNDPEEFLGFYDRFHGKVITKPVHLPARGRLTRPVAPSEVGYAGALRYCPVIVQEYVDKRVELRVTVVGERVFAAEIDSQANHLTAHDSRDDRLGRTPYRPVRLPAAVERSCLALTRALGLAYGAIDLIVTPDGRHVFLEINPNGQYLWVERRTGLPISEALCDLLLEEP
ncbi:MvdC/MvdD family ATP grasp protein [Nonomuraea sp. NPDC050328]|uniref:MvdC/MvdD family ATP grasp protein n=1 Tax=Nonomuraea sp. NPDC050328 TaxID=3364361 RepID=UPI003787E0B3